VFRRTLLAALVVALAAAFALPPSALALRAHVRVEGVNQTIFGPKEPLLTAFTGTLTPEGGTPVELTQPTALGTLEAASTRGEFFYRLVATSFGPFVSQIGRSAGAGSSGWVYKVNGVSPTVGADVFVVKEGDEVLWYWATFGPAGGPPTLDLERLARGCFRAYQVDDAGERTPARRVVFRLDGRSVRSAGGRICPDGHWHRLQATKAGTVRSEVLGPR
jgi:hypothetical protein